MAPILNDHLATIGSWISFIRYTLEPTFTLRDVTVLHLAKGELIARKLPGINGNEPVWLERPTDDY